MITRKTIFVPMLLAIAAVSALADAGDPPSRVARLNYLEGPVSFRPGSVEDWTTATLNYPLTTGDHLWTDDNARAELHVDSTAIRMSARTALAVLNLDDRAVQLSLTEGSLEIHIRYLAEDETFEVDTPNAAVSLTAPGDYRFTADSEQGRTTATVFAGDGNVTANGANFPVHGGDSASITGMDTVTQEMTPAPDPDDFDNWCLARDRHEEESYRAVANYVPQDMIGAEDLNQYGVWREESAYGWVWTPAGLPPDWAPYRYGHWAWVEPWGWTWIDDAPWGFAPFHYGRWAYLGGGWVWVPGRMGVGVRPVYAPALVVFVGGRNFGLSVAIGGGGVAAWFPLGPGEVYRPGYRVSDRYVRNINIVHVTDINVTNIRYANQTVAGAVTAVPNETFVSARSVSRASVAIPREAVMRAEIVGPAAPIAPTRASVLAGARGAVRTPPDRFVDRTVVVRQNPPPPPVSFAAKEEALRGNGGRPLDAAQTNSVRSAAPTPRPMIRTVAPVQQRPFGDSPRPRNDHPPAVQSPRDVAPPPTPRPSQVQPRPNLERPPEERPPAERPAAQPRTENPAPPPVKKEDRRKPEKKSDQR